VHRPSGDASSRKEEEEGRQGVPSIGMVALRKIASRPPWHLARFLQRSPVVVGSAGQALEVSPPIDEGTLFGSGETVE